MNLEMPAGMSLSAMRTEALVSFVAEIFVKLGVRADGARLTAEAIVAADVEGMPSHGVMQVPVYVERMLAGTVSAETEPKVIHDGGSAIVLDAGNALGQLSSDWAIPMVIERAREHGLACIAVRNGFHFGTAGFWARQIAEAGLVGIVMCNSRPLKAPPGGTERLTGNNPLAIALPSSDPHPFVVDPGAGAPAATDPVTAIAGMLLPGAGARGFGLAAAIDLLCGGLSGGAIGPEIGPLNGDAAKPYQCSHLFLALDPVRFGIQDLDKRVAEFSERIRTSKRAAGVERIHAPGDLQHARRANSDECPLAPELLARLRECAAKVGVQRELE
jgi:LDH2 family malate/lactate/ureidoglycolate dehydrogenase